MKKNIAKIPTKLRSITDGNVLEFQETIDRIGREKLAEPKHVFKYIKSSTKLGLTLSVTQAQLQSFIDNKIMEDLE